MALLHRVRKTAETAGWSPVGLALITAAEILLLLGALVPLMESANALDANLPASLAYLWWNGTVTKPGVFVMISLVGGALGGALHAIASLTAHVAAGDFGPRWTMWYLANPVVGASLAIVFLFVLQAGLGGQAAPTTGGLYGIAAVATMTGLFSRHALDKLKDIFDVAFASRTAIDSRASGTGTTGTGTRGTGTTGSGSGAAPSTPPGMALNAPEDTPPRPTTPTSSRGATPGGRP